jgi:hypothetical protein
MVQEAPSMLTGALRAAAKAATPPRTADCSTLDAAPHQAASRRSHSAGGSGLVRTKDRSFRDAGKQLSLDKPTPCAALQTCRGMASTNDTRQSAANHWPNCQLRAASPSMTPASRNPASYPETAAANALTEGSGPIHMPGREASLLTNARKLSRDAGMAAHGLKVKSPIPSGRQQVAAPGRGPTQSRGAASTQIGWPGWCSATVAIAPSPSSKSARL